MVEIDAQIATWFGALAVSATTLIGYLWRVSWWLGDQFKQTRQYLEGLLEKHEDKDQKRHIENVERFSHIEVKLDTVIKNGHN
jgi:hypothetical protein